MKTYQSSSTVYPQVGWEYHAPRSYTTTPGVTEAPARRCTDNVSLYRDRIYPCRIHNSGSGRIDADNAAIKPALHRKLGGDEYDAQSSAEPS